MAIETKMLMSLLSDSVGRANSVREAYNIIAKAANVEGITLPSYDDFRESIKEEERMAKEDKN